MQAYIIINTVEELYDVDRTDKRHLDGWIGAFTISRSNSDIANVILDARLIPLVLSGEKHLVWLPVRAAVQSLSKSLHQPVEGVLVEFHEPSIIP